MYIWLCMIVFVDCRIGTAHCLQALHFPVTLVILWLDSEASPRCCRGGAVGVSAAMPKGSSSSSHSLNPNSSQFVPLVTLINFVKSSLLAQYMRLWHNSASEGGLYAFIKSEKKLIHHKRILGNLTTYVRKPIYHLPTFAMNAGNHGKKSTCCEVNFLCNMRV
jgi:hypothetical protein